MIKLLLDKGDYMPVIICDECNKRIMKAEDGIAFSWHKSTDIGVLSVSEVMQLADLDEPEFHTTVYLHTGQCHEINSEKYDSKDIVVSDQPLKDHLFYLLESLGLSTDGLDQPE